MKPRFLEVMTENRDLGYPVWDYIFLDLNRIVAITEIMGFDNARSAQLILDNGKRLILRETKADFLEIMKALGAEILEKPILKKPAS